MIERPLWLERVRQAWTQRSVVWLSGVRRVGKTTIARMLPEAVYLNCDLPSAVRALEDPELFLSAQAADAVLVFDEVLRLIDPSRLLKIAADEYPHLKVLATGSSTLAAPRKFSDTLAGRKRAIHLCPVLWEECAEPFGVPDLDRRKL
jgi:predicted AAA+ superfamily ATPase